MPPLLRRVEKTRQRQQQRMSGRNLRAAKAVRRKKTKGCGLQTSALPAVFVAVQISKRQPKNDDGKKSKTGRQQ